MSATNDDNEPHDEPFYYQERYETILAKTRNNDIPLSSKELSDSQTDLSTVRNELQRCGDNDIRILLSKTLECQQSLLSPIRRLSSDILELIFDFLVALPAVPNFTHTETDTPCGISVSLTDNKIVGRVFPLTWTCSWWRHQALAQPVLWSSIAVMDLERNDEVGERDLALMKLEALKCILRRSGPSCPMDFRLHISSRLMVTRHDTLPFLTVFSSVPFDHVQSSLVETLTNCVNRWRSFTFHTNSRTNSETFYEVLANRLAALAPGTVFPFLEKLELGSGFSLDDKFPAVRLVGTTFASSCPRLRALEIHSLTSTDLMDLKNLTILELHNYIGSSFVYLLEQCPSLESLSVRFFKRGQDMKSSDSSLHSPLRHTHLKTLWIKGMGEDFASGAWESIRLPNVAEVTISFWFRLREETLDELKEMLIRSDCTWLRRVQLLWESFHISEYDILERFLYEVPFYPECEYYINEGRYPRSH